MPRARAPSIAILVALACACASQKVQIGPANELYPDSIADPYSPVMGVTYMELSENDIRGAGDSRWGLHVGDRIPLVRWSPEDQPDLGFQISIEGQYLGQSDRDHAEDVIGWDGLYGLQFAWKRREHTAWRFGFLHDSSHVGDEFDAPGSQQRQNVTREDLYVGASQDLATALRGYLEYFYAVHESDNPLVERQHVQTGLEFEPKPTMLNGRLGWFAALHASSYEEDDWDPNFTLRTGVEWPLPSLGRVWRFGIEFYDGRSPLGEFFPSRETWVALGFWL